MSYGIGMNVLRLQPTDRLGHTEYCSNAALIRAVTGKDPSQDASTWHDFYDAWEIDLIWTTNDGPVPWHERGRATSMGLAEFLEGGVDKNEHVDCPFTDVEEVWNFDAVEEYGLPDMDELVDYYQSFYKNGQSGHPNQIVTGGYYKTIVSGAIDAFGWDMLLMAAADQEAFDKVLESFFQLTLHHVKAWAKTDIDVYINHDDIVWTQGAFMRPEFYRSAIFPRYKKLWDVLHEAGKMVLFCSDGDFSDFIDDIAQAGADGFIFEPMTNIDYMVERYGKTHAIIGSKVDCRTLTFGTPDQIRKEIDDTLAITKGCPGFMFAVGNHIPSNVPVDNALFYYDYLSKNWNR